MNVKYFLAVLIMLGSIAPVFAEGNKSHNHKLAKQWERVFVNKDNRNEVLSEEKAYDNFVVSVAIGLFIVLSGFVKS